MKKTGKPSISPWNQISWLIGFIGMTVTSFYLKVGTDPFNLPKMFLLTIGGTVVLFLLINEYLVNKRLFSKSVNFLISFIVLANLNAFLLSGAPLVQQFYGVYGRNSGLLTYAMLLVLFIASMRLLKMTEDDKTIGEVYNVGGEGETTIQQLAEKIIANTKSSSGLTFTPYNQAYPAGFEDMQRRVPDITKAKSALNWSPTRNLDQIISDVAEGFR